MRPSSTGWLVWALRNVNLSEVQARSAPEPWAEARRLTPPNEPSVRRLTVFNLGLAAA